MRLVLHPKVYSDIDEIMGYYGELRRETSPMNFTPNCDITCSRPPRGRNPSQFASVISAA